MMNGIDTEVIMENIRAQLPEEEESWAAVRFEDIPVDAAAAAESDGTGAFDKDDFEKNVVAAAESWPVPYYRELPDGKVKGFFKRVVRKLIRFCVEPIAQDVANFQQAVSRALGALRRFVSEQSARERRYEEEIAQLRSEVKELEDRIRELEKK